MANKIEWIKLAVDMFENSRKIQAIETMKNGDTIIVIWYKMLCLAGEINDKGAIYITENVAYADESLAYKFRRPVAIVKKALEIFEEFGMIHRENGIIYLTSWAKYQNIDGLEKIREQARERKQKQRDKERGKNENVTDCHIECHADVTQCHAPKNEEERIKNKEYSFIHSNARDARVEGEVKAVDLPEFRRKVISGIGKGRVILSEEQIGDLLNKMAIDEFNRYVGIVADCEGSGKKYRSKTHYQAILDMARKDRQMEASS